MASFEGTNPFENYFKKLKLCSCFSQHSFRIFRALCISFCRSSRETYFFVVVIVSYWIKSDSEPKVESSLVLSFLFNLNFKESSLICYDNVFFALMDLEKWSNRSVEKLVLSIFPQSDCKSMNILIFLSTNTNWLTIGWMQNEHGIPLQRVI